MASNREERFLMRQRGAGTRQIGDFGFDIALPGTSKSPVKPVLSGRSRRTPRPEPPPQRSLRSTHKYTPLQPERSSKSTPKSTTSRSQRSSNLTPALLQSKAARALRSLNTQQQNGSASQPTRSDGLDNVTKKRKLNVKSSDLDIQRSPSNLPEKSSLVLTEFKSPEAIVAMGVEVADSVLQLDQDNHSADSQHVADAIAPHEPPKKKRKKRKSIGQNSKKRARKAQLHPASQQELDVLDVQPSLSSDKARESHRVPSVSEDANLANPLKAISRKAKRKRGKSIGRLPISHQKSTLGNSLKPENHINPSVDSIEDVSISLRPTTERIERTLGNQFAGIDEKGEEMESGDEASKNQGTKVNLESPNNRTRPRSRPRKSDLASKKEGKEVSIQREAPSRAKSTRTKRTVAPASSAKVQKQARKRQVPSRTENSIPITVYRLSKDLAFDEDDSVSPNLLTRKAGVNAMDVLGQICREMVAKALGTVDEAIEKGQTFSSQAEQKRVKKAIEMFGDELDSQVFQMSEAVDNNHALQSRLRQANKEINAAREELLDIRREREKIALQMDDIRIRHEIASRKSEKTNELNNLLQDIELAVRRGRALQTNGKEGVINKEKELTNMDFVLQHVARKVSSATGPKLLDQVKSFNSLLEKAIATF